jgi:ATP-dependent DNA helicase DinG
MERYFGPNGLLAQKVQGFEYRAPQQEMAQAVFESIRSGIPLLVEAGTGTGKTWAYLIPAILSGKKVVVSTGTKTLQDQILDHDIPLLKRLVSPQLQAVCLKGRRNYLCRRRIRAFAYQPTFRNRTEGVLYRRFQNWATKTETGDRAEISWLPDSFHVWNEVSSSSEQCPGQQCEDHGRCFLTRARSEASRAQLVVVNHHLFFADLALKAKELGEAIPPYDAVVFDEAHQVEDTAGIYFGVQLSSVRVAELSRDIVGESRKEPTLAKSLKGVKGITDQLEVLARTLYQSLSKGKNTQQGRFRLDRDKTGKLFQQTCEQLTLACEQLSAMLSTKGDSKPTIECFHRRSVELAQASREILEQDDPSLVYWYEMTPHAVFLQGTPIEIAPILGKQLYSRTPAVVMTSATLSIAGSFDYARQSLGTPENAKAMNLQSPFDFMKQAMIYIPKGFPLPHEPSFCERMAEQALEILESTRGRALFLFTSYRNMNEMHQQLRDRLPYPLLVQGEKPKRALLAEFKEKVDSVLLATSSFWQGIDVPGEALTCLLIDKLPFEVPDDPLVAARMERMEEQGKSSFYAFQIPRAVIQLKQGIGRLIRSASDHGIIVLFDSRLLTKSYGRVFLKSLPSCRTVHSIGEIGGFISNAEADSGGDIMPNGSSNDSRVKVK